jgi:hypothetical protein
MGPRPLQYVTFFCQIGKGKNEICCNKMKTFTLGIVQGNAYAALLSLEEIGTICFVKL